MSSSNCCFLNCIQVSQEAGQVVWYFYLFKNFPQFVVIQTVKDFGIVNKAEVDVFQNSFAFFDDPTDVGNLISSSSVFSKSSLSIRKFTVHMLLKPGLENFEDYFASVWDECDCAVVWTFFGTAFTSYGYCWVFQIFWHIECSTFTALSFRIWNSTTGIPSPPLALFIVMLPKAHLTSHSRMSVYRWVIIPSWLSGSWRSFLYHSSVYSWHIVISSASVQFSSVAQSCLTQCDHMNRSMPGLPVHHQLLEFTQTHAHRVDDVIQSSYPLSSPSPPAPNPSQCQGLF